jgi:hypothetical protein
MSSSLLKMVFHMVYVMQPQSCDQWNRRLMHCNYLFIKYIINKSVLKLLNGFY